MVFLVLEFEMQVGLYVSLGGVAYVLGLAKVLFLGASILAMLLIYITDLHVLLRGYISQNERLLDGMHEGLLIMKKEGEK